jgi:hypothetical protein
MKTPKMAPQQTDPTEAETEPGAIKPVAGTPGRPQKQVSGIKKIEDLEKVYKEKFGPKPSKRKPAFGKS